jgi:hypothetical protein
MKIKGPSFVISIFFFWLKIWGILHRITIMDGLCFFKRRRRNKKVCMTRPHMIGKNEMLKRVIRLMKCNRSKNSTEKEQVERFEQMI